MTLEELEKKMAELDELQAETKNAHAKLKAQMAELDELQAETENAHAKLIAQMAELKAQNEEKPTPPHPRWTPKENEIYYTIMFSSGNIDILNWSNTYALHKDRFRLGNVYKTKAEAEFAAERMIVLAEMNEWAGEYGDPVSIAYYENDGKVESIAALYPNRGEAVFATYEDAEGCIRAIGQERLKKYYFRVSEDEDDDDRRT